MIKVLYSLPLLLMILISCDNEDQFKTRKVDDRIEFQMPRYMSRITLGNTDAIIEVGNEQKEHYALIIAELVEDVLAMDSSFNIEKYGHYSVTNLKASMTSTKVQRIESDIDTINGLEAISYKLWGIYPDINVPIFYYLTIFKSKLYFYSFNTWTLQDREERYIANMEKMIQSFKEI